MDNWGVTLRIWAEQMGGPGNTNLFKEVDVVQSNCDDEMMIMNTMIMMIIVMKMTSAIFGY